MIHIPTYLPLTDFCLSLCFSHTLSLSLSLFLPLPSSVQRQLHGLLAGNISSIIDEV